MGLPVTGEAATSSVRTVPDESEEGGNEEDESIVHHTASVGDVEVKIIAILNYFNLLCIGHANVLKSKYLDLSYFMRIN